MNDIYSEISEMKELCETLSREIKTINEKMRAGDGKLSPADAEYLDHITHSMASVKKVVHMLESASGGQYSDNYGAYGYGRGYNDGYNDDYGRMQYNARGRSRDSMGRYRDGDMMNDIRQAMNKAPNERVRRALSEAMQEMERA